MRYAVQESNVGITRTTGSPEWTTYEVWDSDVGKANMV